MSYGLARISDNDGPSHDDKGRRRYAFASSPTATPEKSEVGDRKKLGRRGREVVLASRPASPVLHVRAHVKSSWLTSVGVSRKRKRIERKGMPSMKNWRFITLTVCRKKWPDPLQAYLYGLSHIRGFLEGCRKKKIWKRHVKWAWKFEFQADGYPHWHLFVGHRYKLTHRQLEQIGELWGMGRTEVQRIEDSKFGYGFKYAFKPALLEPELGDEPDEFERVAPDWFLDYIGRKTVRVENADGTTYQAEKPVTFKKARFWQTSKGFYTRHADKPSKPTVQKSWGVPLTVRETLKADSRTVLAVARDRRGRYLASQTVVLSHSLERFWALVGFDCLHSGAVGLGIDSYVIPHHRIQTDRKTKWQLHQLLLLNRLTLPQAVKLRNRGQTLRTC